MGFCEPARQDYSPPPPGAGGGASSNGANGGGYAPPPPQISGAQGNAADGNGGRGGDEGVDPEVEKHEYDPEACKVLLWIIHRDSERQLHYDSKFEHEEMVLVA